MILSVIIPSYQHSEYVISCLAAAIEIPVLEKEIIVIDDGSSDGSFNLIQQWVALQPNCDCFKLIQHENRGLVRVLNEGLAIAKGKYIYFVASDDIPNGDGIEKLLMELQKNQRVQFAIGNAKAFLTEGGNNKEWMTYGDAHQRFFDLPSIKRNSEIFLNYPVPLLLQTTLFRREILENIGGWDEKLRWDDYPTFVKILNACPQINVDFIYSSNICMVDYRQHQNNTYRDIQKQVNMIIQALEILCPTSIKNKAISKIYVRFSFSAIRKLKFKMAINFLKQSLVVSNLKITVSEIILIFVQLVKNRLNWHK